ncbi:SDR family oxidoreductase [Pedobacter sp. AW1-32]|uniref:SDR family oxidoreductase n=1 Tax=Pedobacter sp. AW1-32 TaxID=3383026 RepID=UPI003FED644B
MKTILTTGSNGLLGQKLTEKIVAEGRANLIATSKGANRYPIKEGYVYESMDILDENRVRYLLELYKPDAIIHTAALTNVDACEADKETAHQLNVDAVALLLKICKIYTIHFIHLSTDFVFDGEDGPYAEEDAVNPISYYGETKVLAEDLVKSFEGNWAIIRTILVYGVITDMSRSNIVLWAKNALESGSAIQVVNDQWRMPTLAEDLAEACLLAVEKQAQGFYHISGKDYMSVSELVRKVASFWKLDQSPIAEISSASLNQTAKRPRRTGFSLDKAIIELGYRPHSFEEGLAILNKQIK